MRPNAGAGPGSCLVASTAACLVVAALQHASVVLNTQAPRLAALFACRMAGQGIGSLSVSAPLVALVQTYRHTLA